MRKLHVVWGLVGVVVAAVPAWATVIDTRPAIPDLVGGTDVIVVGKITKVPKDFTAALPKAGAKKELYQVIEVSVQQDIQGGKGLTNIKIGIPCNTIISGGKTIYLPLVMVKQGQEACFFVTQHYSKGFYELGLSNMLVQDANYKTDLELTKRCVQLLATPDEGLKSKNAEDRLLTTAMLIRKYRGPLDTFAVSGLTPLNPPPKEKIKEEPIPAGQSKLILGILRDVDWKTSENPTPSSPANLFVRLGLKEGDGWKFKQGQVNFLDGKAVLKARNDLAAAAKAWLKTHADTYRIKRIVMEESARVEGKDSRKDKR